MKKIFLSIGSPSTEAQRDFIAGFKTMMLEANLHPLTADPNSVRPFDNINSTMRKADGVIVVALERYYIPELVERPGGTLRDEKRESNVRLPTTWNQVETAFAHAWNLPVLVMSQSDLKEDGLLDRGNDWNVHRIRIDGRDRELIREQLERFSALIANRRRPLWQIWRSLDGPARIGLISSVLGIGAMIGSVIAWATR